MRACWHHAGKSFRPCTCCRIGNRACPTPASSDPVDLRHPKHSTYGCFLPDLTRFIALRRAGPGRQRRLARTVPRDTTLEQGFNPAIADCGYRAPLAPRLARPEVTVRDRSPPGQDVSTRSLRVGLGLWHDDSRLCAAHRHQKIAGFHPLCRHDRHCLNDPGYR
jgi:hypothetical protein